MSSIFQPKIAAVTLTLTLTSLACGGPASPVESDEQSSQEAVTTNTYLVIDAPPGVYGSDEYNVITATRGDTFDNEEWGSHVDVIKNGELKVGDTLTFKNRDNESHTITSLGTPDAAAQPGAILDRRLAPGKSLRVRFREVGTYTFFCRDHQETMHTKVYATFAKRNPKH
jgi:hypothetical protein